MPRVYLQLQTVTMHHLTKLQLDYKGSTIKKISLDFSSTVSCLIFRLEFLTDTASLENKYIG